MKRIRPALIIQYVAATSLVLLPWLLLASRSLLWPLSGIVAGYWLVLLVVAAIWHRNVTET